MEYAVYSYNFLLAVLAVLAVQDKATSSEWKQSTTPIKLVLQSMSLLSVPRQRSSSSHIGVVDEAREKL